MALQWIHLLGSGLALVGWVFVLLACIIPMWRVTRFTGTTIVTSETMCEGIWMSCVIQSTGQMQCDPHDSTLVLSYDLKAARVLTVGSLLTGSLGLILAFIGGKCTRFLEYSSGSSKGKVVTAAGVVLIISALLCLIPVAWATATVVKLHHQPQTNAAQRREIGSAIYIGWIGSILLLLGGGMLCSTFYFQNAEEHSPSVNYRVVCSEAGSSIRSSEKVHSISQNRMTLAPVSHQQQKPTSEGSRKSKTSAVRPQESMMESDEFYKLSTKSKLNHAESDHSLESSDSELISKCPERTYI